MIVQYERVGKLGTWYLQILSEKQFRFLLEYPTTIEFKWCLLKNDPYSYTVNIKTKQIYLNQVFLFCFSLSLLLLLLFRLRIIIMSGRIKNRRLSKMILPQNMTKTADFLFISIIPFFIYISMFKIKFHF